MTQFLLCNWLLQPSHFCVSFCKKTVWRQKHDEKVILYQGKLSSEWKTKWAKGWLDYYLLRSNRNFTDFLYFHFKIYFVSFFRSYVKRNSPFQSNTLFGISSWKLQSVFRCTKYWITNSMFVLQILVPESSRNLFWHLLKGENSFNHIRPIEMFPLKKN